MVFALAAEPGIARALRRDRIMAWDVFAAAASLADWGLERTALLSPAPQALEPFAAAGIVGLAGLSPIPRRSERIPPRQSGAGRAFSTGW